MAKLFQLEKDLQNPLMKMGVSLDPKGYVDDVNFNVFNHQMCDDHKNMIGRMELKNHARAAHSSSMLPYNFFSWINENNPFEWKGVKYSQVFFEVKLPVLLISNIPAKMDVVLKGKKDNKTVLLFIESKFTEYLTPKTFKISESYLKRDSYYSSKIIWPELIDNWSNRNIRAEYQEGIKQSFCHLIGLNNLKNKEAFIWYKKHNKLIINKGDIILFANLVFSPNKKQYEKEEYKKYMKYYNLYKVFQTLLRENKGISIQPQWYSYSQIWGAMRDQLNKYNHDRVEYLQERYMQFAQK